MTTSRRPTYRWTHPGRQNPPQHPCPPIPKALAIAAVRTRPAAVAALFTAISGVGPTLAQDSTAYFHANLFCDLFHVLRVDGLDRA